MSDSAIVSILVSVFLVSSATAAASGMRCLFLHLGQTTCLPAALGGNCIFVPHFGQTIRCGSSHFGWWGCRLCRTIARSGRLRSRDCGCF